MCLRVRAGVRARDSVFMRCKCGVVVVGKGHECDSE
jgi:hypothetical protein